MNPPPANTLHDWRWEIYMNNPTCFEWACAIEDNNPKDNDHPYFYPND